LENALGSELIRVTLSCGFGATALVVAVDGGVE
jgi:hypothetical protein